MSNNRPVIAHVLHRLDRAGAEVLAAGLARQLQDRFEFAFLCLDGLGSLADELSKEGFVVEALGRNPGIDRALGRKMHQRLKALGVSFIHAHQYTPFFYSSLARGVWRRRLPDVPILFTEHGRHYPDRRSTKRVWANKLLLKPGDRVTAVGRYVRDALVANEGIASSRIDVIYNGIEPGPAPVEEQRASARDDLGIESDRPVVMQVARFHAVKDHATAIRAWQQVTAQQPNALLVLIGDGDQRSAMQRLAGELGIEHAVRFTGALDHARQLIPVADVCILTSLSEGVSVTLLEAMAAARPTVATEVGGNPEVVEPNSTGLLAPRGDHHAIAEHLLTLLNDKKKAQTLGQAGRMRLIERFTQEQMHRGYAQLYESLAADSRG